MAESETFEIEIDGRRIQAKKGQTIAAALLVSGLRTFRQTRKDEPRGLFCGIGVCFECRMTVNGVPNTRTCVTEASPGCKVQTQRERQQKGIEP
ncbi:MAG: (2Fe-2S)-binding protein [Thermodesulfobacteriota bacterium]